MNIVFGVKIIEVLFDYGVLIENVDEANSELTEVVLMIL